MAATFASRNEDNIALARVDVAVFQDEELIDAIFFQGGNLDNGTYRTDEAPVEYQILFTADLVIRSAIPAINLVGSLSRSMLVLPHPVGAGDPFETYSAPARC